MTQKKLPKAKSAVRTSPARGSQATPLPHLGCSATWIRRVRGSSAAIFARSLCSFQKCSTAEDHKIKAAGVAFFRDFGGNPAGLQKRPRSGPHSRLSRPQLLLPSSRHCEQAQPLPRAGLTGATQDQDRLTRFCCSLVWLSTALELGGPHTLQSSDRSQASFLFFKLGFFFLNVRQIAPKTMECLPIAYLNLFTK